jgi:hypothetical protein
MMHGGIDDLHGLVEPPFGFDAALPLVASLLARDALGELRLMVRGVLPTSPALPAWPSGEVTAAFARSLAANTSLHTLQLDHFVGAALAPAARLTDALTANSSLQTLEIDAVASRWDDGGGAAAAGAAVLHAVAHALAADCALTTLKFCGAVPGLAAALPALGDALRANTHAPARARSGGPKDDPCSYTAADRLDSAALQPLAAALASSNRALRLLGVRACRVDDGAARVLAGALAANSNAQGLTALLLDRNCIGPDGASALAQSLHGNSTLAVLDLSGDVPARERDDDHKEDQGAGAGRGMARGNAAGDAGAVAFGALLSSGGGGGALRELRLTKNGVGDAGGAALSRALRVGSNSARLEVPLLDRNGGRGGIGAATVRELCEALPANATLKTLDISRLSAAGAEQLQTLVAALQRNSTLTRFQARNTHTHRDDARRWHAALRRHPSLRPSQVRFCTRQEPGSGGSQSFTDE